MCRRCARHCAHDNASLGQRVSTAVSVALIVIQLGICERKVPEPIVLIPSLQVGPCLLVLVVLVRCCCICASRAFFVLRVSQGYGNDLAGIAAGSS
jgi:hypothetical protein